MNILSMMTVPEIAVLLAAILVMAWVSVRGVKTWQGWLFAGLAAGCLLGFLVAMWRLR